MSSAVSLPNHTFTGQALSSKRLTSIVHILSPETDNCPSWISGRERMTVENISWSISAKECWICKYVKYTHTLEYSHELSRCTHMHYLNKQIIYQRNKEHNAIYIMITGDALVIQQLPGSRNMHVRTRACKPTHPRPPACMHANSLGPNGRLMLHDWSFAVI